MHPLHSPPPYPPPQAGDDRVGGVGPGEECPAAPGQNAMAGLPDTVIETKPRRPVPTLPRKRGMVGTGVGAARSFPPSCSWHSWRKTMKEVETNV